MAARPPGPTRQGAQHQGGRSAKDLAEKHHIIVLSSNYTVYGDISDRVMTLLRGFSPNVEAYSITLKDSTGEYFRLFLNRRSGGELNY